MFNGVLHRLIKGVAGGVGRSRMDAGERMQSSSSKICTEVVITLIWGRAVALQLKKHKNIF